MDNIRKLEELKNELKILSNKQVLKYSKLEDLYSKLQMEMDELEDLLAEINEKQYTQLKLEILSFIGLSISIIPVNQNIENSSYFLIAFIIIFVINTIKYVKGIIEYSDEWNNYQDTKYKKEKIEKDAQSIKKNIDQLRNEIDNIYEIIRVNDDIKAKDYIEKSSRNLKLINDMQNM